jgi:hypothetical protein
MRQYYILTTDPNLASVLGFIKQHQLEFELHINRTRFWIDPQSPAYTEFALRWASSCPPVDETLDLATGLSKEKPYE